MGDAPESIQLIGLSEKIRVYSDRNTHWCFRVLGFTLVTDVMSSSISPTTGLRRCAKSSEPRAPAAADRGDSRGDGAPSGESSASGASPSPAPYTGILNARTHTFEQNSTHSLRLTQTGSGTTLGAAWVPPVIKWFKGSGCPWAALVGLPPTRRLRETP